jgi:hypothetical protein
MKKEEELEFISVNTNDDDFSMNQKYSSPLGGIAETGDSVIGNWIFKQSKVFKLIINSR